MQKQFPDIKIVKRADYELDGYPSKLIIFTDKDQDLGELQRTTIMTIKDNSLFTIAFLAKLDTHDTYFPTVKKMVASFEFLSPKELTINLDSLRFTTYESPELSLRLDYPLEWSKIDSKDDFLLQVIKFVAPTENDYDVYQEMIMIVIQKQFVLTLDEYVEENLQELPKGVKNFKMLKSEAVVVAGIPAHKIVFSATDKDDYDVKTILIITVKDDKGYLFLLASETEKFSYYLPIFQKTIESLEIGTIEYSQKLQIPDWVRNNASWWVEGNIDDKAFVGGIQFLIKEGIMQIPETTSSQQQSVSQDIPSWIKNNADWWSQGLISDDDFVKGIQYLVEQGIVVVN